MKITGELERLEDQGVDLSQIVIQGSAPLALLGIVPERQIGDIDMVVSRKTFAHLEKELGWRRSESPITGDIRLQDRRKKFDAWPVWFDGLERRSYRDMRSRSHRIGGLAVGCITKDIQSYKSWRLEKSDEEHLLAIKDYLESHPAYGLECAWSRQLYNIDQVRELMVNARDLARETARNPVRALGNIATMRSQRTPEEVVA